MTDRKILIENIIECYLTQNNLTETEANEIVSLRKHLKSINYMRCSLQLKNKKPISFGRYCATRGYHKFEGNWVNRQKFPRDIEWIKKQYEKDIFDL